MTRVSVLALAAAASIDCLIIGFNYGVKGVRIGHGASLFMALICFAGTWLSMVLGRLVGCVLHPVWGEVAGGALLLLLGLWMLAAAFFPKPAAKCRDYSENPEKVDKDASKVIEARESLLIGLLLCVNNVGIGVGGGMAGLPLIAAPAACSAFSYLFVMTGRLLGGRVESSRLARTLEAASALLLLCLGGWQVASSVLLA